MCRLFGFRSVIQSQVHRSLLDADNALAAQSSQHPDGWGVAFYVDGSPHVTRSSETALSDQLFHRVSGIVSSETVVAHIRKATTGPRTVLNTHPFQYGRWVFAHNGQVYAFEEHAAEIEAHIAPRLKRFILGDTDSERVFYLFLTHLSQRGELNARLGLDAVMGALADTVNQIREITDGSAEAEKSLMTLLVTDGITMAAVHGGKELYWSSYKHKCLERDDCPHYAPECENPSRTGFVNHLIFSSEPLSDQNVWLPLESGDMVGVDWRMQVMQRRA